MSRKVKVDWSNVATSVTASVAGNVVFAALLILAGRFALTKYLHPTAALPPAAPQPPTPVPVSSAVQTPEPV